MPASTNNKPVRAFGTFVAKRPPGTFSGITVGHIGGKAIRHTVGACWRRGTRVVTSVLDG